MKQIKTIYYSTERNETKFDEAVNEALADGWSLIKRDVIQAVNCGNVYYHRSFYAELEKDVTVKKSCSNCKYHALSSQQNPCRDCLLESNWEPQT